MDAIVYDAADNSRLNGPVHALGMRLGYLIANVVNCGGHHTYPYNVILNAAKTFTPKQKLEILVKTEDPKYADMLAPLQGAMKSLNKIKRKNAEGIRLERQTNTLINEYFDELWLADYKEAFYRRGFMKLFSDSEVFEPGVAMFYVTNAPNPEIKVEDHQDLMSDLMMRRSVHPPNIILIPFLPLEFFGYKPATDATVPFDDAAANDDTKMWLTRCLSFPNVMRLSDNEMAIVRRQTSAAATPLRQAVDQWDELFKNGADADTRRRFFQDRILPAAQELQAAYDRNEILQLRGKATAFEVYFGEMPFSLMWEFFREMEVIKDPTWNVLQQKLKEDENMPLRCPVMAYNYIPPGNGNEGVEELSALTATKKSIAVE